MKEKLDGMLEAARSNRKQLNDDANYKYQRLTEQRVHKEKTAQELKDEMRHSIEFKKELMQLRKVDQLDNVHRWKEFSKLYTSKLAEKIVEMKHRVEHIQQEQLKIVQICELQRAQIKGFATFQSSKFHQTVRSGGDWKSANTGLEMNKTH